MSTTPDRTDRWPRTAPEMRARIAAIRGEMEELEQRCAETSSRLTYRRLSVEMEGLEQEWRLYAQMAAQLERKQAVPA